MQSSINLKKAWTWEWVWNLAKEVVMCVGLTWSLFFIKQLYSRLVVAMNKHQKDTLEDDVGIRVCIQSMLHRHGFISCHSREGLWWLLGREKRISTLAWYTRSLKHISTSNLKIEIVIFAIFNLLLSGLVSSRISFWSIFINATTLATYHWNFWLRIVIM